MRVRLLGTGSADGWPNPFCVCPCCQVERRAGRHRGQTSALVDGVLLLDCGPETPHAAQRAGCDLSALRHVLVTHAHPDHCAPAFLLFRSWAHDSGDSPLDVVGPAEAVDAARMWVAPEAPVTFTRVSPGDRLRLGRYDVRVLDARHGTPGSSVLYDVGSPSGRLLYATDTGPLPEGTVEAVRDAAFDLVLIEQTFGDVVTHGTDHLDLATFPEQLRRLRAAGAVTRDTDVVAVHLSHHNPPTPELQRRLSAWGARAGEDGAVVAVGRTDGPAPSGPVGPRRTLVVGGARSGKSREAERILAAEPRVTYVATGYPAGDDDEWADRIRRHRADRPARWTTAETLDLAGLLREPGPPLLVDCLTLWLTRVIDRCGGWDDESWASTAERAVREEVDALVAAWRSTDRRVVAVSNEVGQGVVPDSAAGRRFRDEMGRLNARVAAVTEDVRWCVAGRVTAL